MIEILYHIHAFVTINNGAVSLTELPILRPRFQKSLTLGSYNGLGSHSKTRYHMFIHG